MSASDLSILLLTLRVAAVSTLSILPFGIAAAWLLSRWKGRGKVSVETLLSLPLVLPPTAVGLVLLEMLTRSGPLGRLLDRAGVEILFTLMGTGCESVTRVHTPEADLVVGKWRGGRLGTFRGIRAGKAGYGATVFGNNGIRASHPERTGYRPLLEEIVKFFKTGVPPVSPAETLEIFAFMQAAELSKTRNSQEIPFSEVIHSNDK